MERNLLSAGVGYSAIVPKSISLVAAAFLTTVTHPASAGISSGWSSGSIVVLAEPEPKRVAASVVMQADFVSVPIRIFSEQKNTAQAYDETRQAIELIWKKAMDSGRFRTTMGVVSLSQHRGGYGLSSGSWSQPAASADLFLLVPLSTNSDNIFGAGVEAAKFGEGLSLPGKTRCELGRLQLAVENPEQYGAKVLALIRQEMQKTREALAPQGGVNAQGLEGPVMVGQLDDRNVELFLNYSLSITAEK